MKNADRSQLLSFVYQEAIRGLMHQQVALILLLLEVLAWLLSIGQA